MAENKNSAARIKANNHWAAKAYDRINCVVPKGNKEVIQAAANAAGESVNSYVVRAINARISGAAPEPAAVKRIDVGQEGSAATIIPPEALAVAQAAAEAQGKPVPDWIANAITSQADREKRMGRLRQAANQAHENERKILERQKNESPDQ